MEPAYSKPLAHPGKRFQAQFIDGLIAYLLGFIVYYLLDPLTLGETAIYSGLTAGVLYFLLSDALPDGQSLGKKLLNIQVVSKSTMAPCSLLQALLRNITFPLGMLDWIFIFFGSHQRLGDFLAATIVVKK
ncbi:RDD family protein [Pseudomethylobacillus aquaticus]|uniref:RDD family protein n=1 Tax=Pseudomethylobacillus aquaticus TaxID=2676064 RepID=A0A3N0UVB1_9PROT|nr:RDD family protein [Pseudomethylobacillus aquaticus]ROH84477.1 RDD family protein [Pseudomethylobacillus aquaticus]